MEQVNSNHGWLSVPSLEEESAVVILKDCDPSDAKSRAANPAHSSLRIFAANLRDEAIRGARAIDRCLDAFYLPTEAQEQKKKCSPDSVDAIRLHGLGVRW